MRSPAAGTRRSDSRGGPVLPLSAVGIPRLQAWEDVNLEVASVHRATFAHRRTSLTSAAGALRCERAPAASSLHSGWPPSRGRFRKGEIMAKSTKLRDLGRPANREAAREENQLDREP